MGSLVLTGDTSGSGTITVPAVAGTFTATIGSATGAHYPFTAGTAVASTSGTSIDFTSIPSWVKRITVILGAVSTNGTSAMQVQIGYSGGIETSGYSGSVGNKTAETFYTSGFVVNRGYTATSTGQGTLVLTNVSGNIWVANGVMSSSATDAPAFFAGVKTTTGTLDRVRITTVNGTDTFDAGSINILYE